MRLFTKVSIKPLRSLGFDERWLQQRISDDPTLLGLGQLTVVERERQMIGGGRLDLLLADRESDYRYELEMMLGKLDESHIVRTIEYWDIERRRYPSLNHCAVIVAEEITSRFLNVISLLNKSVPLIALKMSALDLDDKIGLTFVKVLDLSETYGDFGNCQEPQTQVTRSQWESEGYQEALKVIDLIVDKLRSTGGHERVTYTNQYVSIATTGSNLVWCHPRKAGGQCRLEFKVGPEGLENWTEKLSNAELGEVSHDRRYIKFSVSAPTFSKHSTLLGELIDYCERQTRIQ